jgi:hypothetical protein
MFTVLQNRAYTDMKLVQHQENTFSLLFGFKNAESKSADGN